jgi:hypothetical protein
MVSLFLRNSNLTNDTFCIALKTYKVNLLMLSERTKYIYYDCEIIDQRKKLLAELSILKTYENSFYLTDENLIQSNLFIFNSIFKDNSKLKIGENTVIYNCEFNKNFLEIGENCFLNDLSMVSINGTFYKIYFI